MPRTPFIVVFCGRHRYCFVYAKGQEEELISTMVRYAADDRFNFGWAELRSITGQIETQRAAAQDPPGTAKPPG